jgi:hypothetical protein
MTKNMQTKFNEKLFFVIEFLKNDNIQGEKTYFFALYRVYLHCECHSYRAVCSAGLIGSYID